MLADENPARHSSFAMRTTFLLLALSLFTPKAHADDAPVQTKTSRAPGANELSVGYGFMPISKLPLTDAGGVQRPMGLAIEGRHLWQVRGLDGSTPAWLGFGTSFLANFGPARRNSYLLDYGIYVRHALFPRPKIRAFVGYGLGAVQAFVQHVGGRGIGHLTLLSMGVEARLRETLHATVELGYRFVILPHFETALEPARRYDSHGIRLNFGLFFGR